MAGGGDPKWQKDAGDQNFDYMFKLTVCFVKTLGEKMVLPEPRSILTRLLMRRWFFLSHGLSCQDSWWEDGSFGLSCQYSWWEDVPSDSMSDMSRLF
uniref:Uncharacterized protein n=1 Tax=Megaselia scalaris TaxID=36166 RepID=T1GQ62_MEGSC